MDALGCVPFFSPGPFLQAQSETTRSIKPAQNAARGTLEISLRIVMENAIDMPAARLTVNPN